MAWESEEAMRLHTTITGYRAQALAYAGGEGRVLGVFRHACSLSSGDGWVLALAGRPRLGPLSLLVPGLEGALGLLRPGQAACLSGESICLPEADLIVDLLGAEVWRGVVLPAGPLAGAAVRRARVREALRLSLRVPSRSGWMALLPELFPDVHGEAPSSEAWRGEGDPTLRRRALGAAAAGLHGLRQALDDRRMDLACRYAEDLVGLGAGLTPSGDDFLSGLLLAFCWALRAGSEAAGWLAALGSLVAQAAHGRTTLVGEQQIRLAALGEADQALGQAVVALLWEASPVVEPLLELLEVGSTSGADMLAGACFASELLGAG